MLIDKKNQMRVKLCQLIETFPNESDQNETLIDQFISQYFQNKPQLLEQHALEKYKPESLDFSQQINFDFQTIQKANKVDRVKDKIEQFHDIQQKIQEKLDS